MFIVNMLQLSNQPPLVPPGDCLFLDCCWFELGKNAFNPRNVFNIVLLSLSFLRKMRLPLGKVREKILRLPLKCEQMLSVIYFLKKHHHC